MKHEPCYVQPDGHLPTMVRERIKNTLNKLIGKKVYITIQEAKDKCTIDALRYYRGVLVPAVRAYRAEQGDPVTPECCHEQLLVTFSEYETIVGLDGIPHSVPKRTFTTETVLDKDGFYKYCLAIEGFLANEGVPIKMRAT
jgi:hypothetical protein